jgi:Protein kinase domain
LPSAIASTTTGRVNDAFVGSVVAGHRVTRLIGRGGMGRVYEAVELSLDRTVAIKLVAPDLAEEPGFRERFISESKVAAAIDHPNVLPIFSAGEQDGLLFLAMRLVSGRDLRTLVVEDGQLSPPRAARIVLQIAAALDAAHARKLVHRDVKPANVLLTPEEHAYLTDFGLVKDLDVSAGPTVTGQVLGTFDYIAPELIRGEPVGPWTDVYSLGCVLFFALTARVVFPLDTPEGKLWAHLDEPPPSLSTVRTDIASDVDDVIAKAMAKDPRERYESASALGAAAIEAASAHVAAVAPGDDGRLAAPIARLLAAARRNEQGIRAAAGTAQLHYPEVSREADDFLRTMEQTAAHAQLLSEALQRLPREQFERRLADIRSRHVPAKPQLVDALAKQLKVQRAMEARLENSYAEMERIIVELETVRCEVLSAAASGDDDAERLLAGNVRALRDELCAVDEGMETILAEGRGLDDAPPELTDISP